ncbi:MAG: hypothetical protein UY26_C0002G0156 [Candidatus Jorgensenbacteria bacterium GW2011_GWA1_48_13]|uniref:Uncharacterized protein n=2 Tax=Candidatus Joergenseniibacteriota TaxID=1752739 RepID=A0A0G1W9T5_9BACT|nr:MAG: hypothetical protein UY26_C0002G0156 [Candidatus Jorgensenbacteria bacterium GW2011_GWA1_48_13]KKU98810.1 MAG: hypothetical protein UY32_C0013G0007 [Candidatus Jorgensenbacteria bacterium GW2011_GWC1_48_8]KKW15355.1 MAG: hypothetical protein UY55_C0001G0109 [Candidatus Jorgensenbacteria bacterium GW2011_GWB1_50_10]
MKTFRNPLFYLVILLGIAVVFGVVQAAFTEPSNSFPGSAPAAPLDTSSLEQTKSGNLILDAIKFTGTNAIQFQQGQILSVGAGFQFTPLTSGNQTLIRNSVGSILLQPTGSKGVLVGDVSPGFTASLITPNVLISGGSGADAQGIYLGVWQGVAGFYTIKTGDASAPPLAFLVGDSERVRINTSGDVGIGTSNPTTKLEVIGTASSTEVCISGDCKTAWPAGAVSQWTSISGGRIYYNGGSVGIGTDSPNESLDVGGNIKTSGNLLLPIDSGFPVTKGIYFGSSAFIGYAPSLQEIFIVSGSGAIGFKDGGIKIDSGGTILLPTCDDTRRGMLKFVKRFNTPNSAWDELYLCRIKGDGAYEWEKIT